MPENRSHFNAVLIGAVGQLHGLHSLLATSFPTALIEEVSAVPVALSDSAVCFFDFCGGTAAAFEALDELQHMHPSAAAVAVLPENKPELILDCLRAGASAFLVQPLTADQLDTAIETIARRNPWLQSPAASGQAIAIVPARGGSGATTLACDLAFECRRQGAARTLLCDLDPLAGTVSFRLKLKSQFSFLDALVRNGSLETALWNQMVERTSGIDVLLAPERIVDPSGELQAVDPLIRWARPAYDLILSDTSGPYGAWNVSIARQADTILLVCSGELPSLHAVRRATAWFSSHGIETARIKAVLNRVSPHDGLPPERFAEATGLELFGAVPADSAALTRCLFEGRPAPRTSAFGQSIAELSSRLIAKEKVSATKGKAGLLSSFFSSKTRASGT